MKAKLRAQGIYEQTIQRFTQFHEESNRKFNMWTKKKEEDQEKTQHKHDPNSQKKAEMNLDVEYWKSRFLYPFALDTGPMRISTVNDKV